MGVHSIGRTVRTSQDHLEPHRLKSVLLVRLFEQFLLVFWRLEALVGNDARGGRRAGQFAGAAAGFTGGGKFSWLGFGFASAHGRVWIPRENSKQKYVAPAFRASFAGLKASATSANHPTILFTNSRGRGSEQLDKVQHFGIHADFIVRPRSGFADFAAGEQLTDVPAADQNGLEPFAHRRFSVKE